VPHGRPGKPKPGGIWRAFCYGYASHSASKAAARSLLAAAAACVTAGARGLARSCPSCAGGRKRSRAEALALHASAHSRPSQRARPAASATLGALRASLALRGAQPRRRAAPPAPRACAAPAPSDPGRREALLDTAITVLFGGALLLSASAALASFAQGGALGALAARPFALPAASLLLLAKFLTSSAIFAVEALCAALYQVPSALALPLSLGLIALRARAARRRRAADAAAFAAQRPGAFAAAQAAAAAGGLPAEAAVAGGPTLAPVYLSDQRLPLQDAPPAVLVQPPPGAAARAQLAAADAALAQREAQLGAAASAAAAAQKEAAQRAAAAVAERQAARARAAGAATEAQRAAAAAASRAAAEAAAAEAQRAAAEARAAADFRASAIAKAKAELAAKAGAMKAAAAAAEAAPPPALSPASEFAAANLPSMLDASNARLPDYFPAPAAEPAAERSGTVKVRSAKPRKTLQEMSMLELGGLAAQLMAADAIERLRKGEGGTMMIKAGKGGASSVAARAEPDGQPQGLRRIGALFRGNL